MKGLIISLVLAIFGIIYTFNSVSVACPQIESSSGTDQSHNVDLKVQNMLVAPNQNRILGKVLRIERSPQFTDRWNLKIEILSIQPIHGGIFAEAGQIVDAFTITEQLLFKKDNVISADAEYVGNPNGGWFQLTRITVEEAL
ncbi:MAG: hypothetical protein Kow00121_01500 [Elainellaceae cyanobacterium]